MPHFDRFYQFYKHENVNKTVQNAVLPSLKYGHKCLNVSKCVKLTVLPEMSVMPGLMGV